ncbi:MAG: hypothetical protein K2X86_14590 [Cytophagaceae bacterium]|nr:hypothetical protein [Cytophagaceae bacterium]
MKKVFIFLLAIAVFGCKDKKEVAPTASFLLSNNDVKSWQVISYKVDGEIKDDTCIGDDILEFKLNTELVGGRSKRTIVKSEGFVRCDVSTDILAEGYWFLSNDNETLYLTSSSSYYNITEEYKILELTSDRLHIRKIDYSDDRVIYGIQVPVIEIIYERR